MDCGNILLLVCVAAAAYFVYNCMSSNKNGNSNHNDGSYQASMSGEVELVDSSSNSKERMIARKYGVGNAARFDAKQRAKAEAQSLAKAAQSVQPSANELVPVSLLPKNGDGKEGWQQKFARAENMTLQENFVAGNQESFLTNEVQGKKNMNIDLRKSPVVPTIAGLSPWNLHTVHPSNIAFGQTRPSLDGED
jgi:hypothetical protein